MKRIMIVEDEALTALNLKANLQLIGYDIAAIESTGYGAIQKARQLMPDLILMDIRLADDINGIDAMKEIIKFHHIPVIFLTAHSDEETLKDAKVIEPYGYLVKPIDIRTLKATIDIAFYKHEMDKKLRAAQEELKAKNDLLENINKDLYDIAIQLHKVNFEKEKMLIQQSKLASLGEVLSAITHQWRQPLNAIALLVQNLDEIKLENEEDNLKIQNTINETMQQVNFMSLTIEDFKFFIKPSEAIVTFSIKKAISHIINLLQSVYLNSNIIINFTCPEELTARGVLNEFKHAILNIVNNSKDAIISASQRGLLDKMSMGVIDINVTIDEKSNKIISIRDNGGGIQEDILPNIFDCYFSTKGEEKGTGLGLFIVKKIIEEHMNGVIYARNWEKGAEFIIKL
ncbi:MAG TPA: response regulator [Nitrospirae bacterium]|nr:response regulator [Nitrospirota bacterium]